MRLSKLTGKLILFLLPLLVLMGDFPALAAAEPSLPAGKRELRLSLRECMRLTLENNLELIREGLTPRIRQAQISQEEAAFDISTTFDISKEVTENRTATVLAGANVSRQENLFANIGTKKKLASGGTLELDFNNKQFRSNSTWITLNPYYESSLGLKLTQPLLENMGFEVNEAPITIAVNNRLISLLQLKQKIIEITSEAQKIYWDVVYSYENLKVKRLYLKQARDLLNINRAKVAVGSLPKFGIEILEAESKVAARQAEVIAAEDELRDVEDRLKNITNLVQETQNWQLSITPTETPTTKVIDPSLQESIEIALKCRPDYSLLQKKLANKKIDLRLAENKRLPSLDLIGQWGINGLGDSYGDNMQRLADANYRNWLVGVSLEIPWGNRWADGNYLEKKLAARQVKLELEDLGKRIVMEIREAVRQIKTDLKRIQATKTAREMEEKSLATVEEMRKVGEKGFTDHTVMEYQTQLAEAKIRHLKAIIDYNKSLIDFGVRKGTFLEDNGIKLEKLFPDT